uniref:Macaca fascicularis brain cDNA, clone: QorA-10155 n=1 Tax=Macaca fascicularis TaxID=9541 RepID=I7G301_MACFA|nr:unnamed protein product [Macaca fascicularis]
MQMCQHPKPYFPGIGGQFCLVLTWLSNFISRPSPPSILQAVYRELYLSFTISAYSFMLVPI